MKRITELLDERNLKQNKFAADIGVSTSNVSEWKNESFFPSAAALIKIADYFHVSVDYLLERTDVREMAGSLSELEKLNAQLNAEGQAKLLDTADDMVSSGKYKKGTTSNVG